MTSQPATNRPGARPPDVDRVLGFVTRARVSTADGRVLVFESRRSRKGLGPRVLDEPAPSLRTVLRPLWAPVQLSWWIAVLFIVGSLLFVVGSVSGYADAVGPRADAITYFVGSVFFTLASYLAFRQCVSSAAELTQPASARRRWLAWRPRQIDWWSTGVQLAGTVMFNISTFAAISSSLTMEQANRLVWAPDMFGSVCFLVASLLAWFEVCHSWWRVDRRDPGWWAAGLNLLGSIAFQISAVAAATRPATGDEVNVAIAVNGTLFGAVCFLIGAYLLLPEARSARITNAAPSAS